MRFSRCGHSAGAANGTPITILALVGRGHGASGHQLEATRTAPPNMPKPDRASPSSGGLVAPTSCLVLPPAHHQPTEFSTCQAQKLEFADKHHPDTPASIAVGSSRFTTEAWPDFCLETCIAAVVTAACASSRDRVVLEHTTHRLPAIHRPSGRTPSPRAPPTLPKHVRHSSTASTIRTRHWMHAVDVVHAWLIHISPVTQDL
jgi:hypothetical protein